MGRPKGSKNKVSTERTTESTSAGTIGTGNDDRLARFNEIADRADEYRASDLEDVDRPMPEEPEDHDQEDPDNQDEDITSEIEAKTAEPITPELIKRIVNGKEVEHTIEEWLTIASKVEAADQYLRYAAESVKNAASMALSPKEDEPDDEADKALARAIQMGSEDEAVQAIRKIKAKPSVPDVSAQVNEALTLREAKRSFETEYAELFADPMLKKLVYEKDAELNQLDPMKPYTQRWREAAEEVKGWYQEKVKTPPKVDKAARKALVAPVPTAAGRMVEPQDDDAEETPESIIADMAKRRGQGRAIRH